jgi:transcriptional regulator with XRE-family HTH domain
MSLRELARLSGLSPSFVSQLERGLARPRITTLHRVARVLGTSAQALLSTGPLEPYSLVRYSEKRDIGIDGTDDTNGIVRSLMRGDRALAALEFRGAPQEHGQYYDHPGEEMNLVIQGQIEVDLDGELLVLSAGDCLSYDGRIPHRSRSIGPTEALFYLITVRDDVARS